MNDCHIVPIVQIQCHRLDGFHLVSSFDTHSTFFIIVDKQKSETKSAPKKKTPVKRKQSKSQVAVKKEKVAKMSENEPAAVASTWLKLGLLFSFYVGFFLAKIVKIFPLS
jgi:phage/plasmid primase-like uncharacterized protein